MTISGETLDNTLKILGLGLGGGFGIKVVAVAVEIRDAIRDHIRDVGRKDPPSGLFKKVAELEEVTNEHTELLIRKGLRADRRRQH